MRHPLTLVMLRSVQKHLQNDDQRMFLQMSLECGYSLIIYSYITIGMMEISSLKPLLTPWKTYGCLLFRAWNCAEQYIKFLSVWTINHSPLLTTSIYGWVYMKAQHGWSLHFLKRPNGNHRLIVMSSHAACATHIVLTCLTE